jgi:hypothetical protein
VSAVARDSRVVWGQNEAIAATRPFREGDNTTSDRDDCRSRPDGGFWRRFRIATLIRNHPNCRHSNMPHYFRGQMLLMKFGALTRGDFGLEKSAGQII